MALSFIPFAFPGAPGVRCAFQTRDWGVSEGPYGGGNIAYTVGDDPLRVSANRLDLAASLELAEIAELDQIHGDTLVFDPPPSPLERFVEPPAFPKGDGLATDKPGIGLIIYQSIFTSDFPVTQAAILIVAAIFVGINLLIDLLRIVADPRLRK